MFRINQAVTRSGTTINIDGQLTKEYAQFAEQYCSELLATGKRLDVFLSDVSEVDEAGRNFLRQLANRGISVHAKGVYMRYLLNQIRRSGKNDIALPSPSLKCNPCRCRGGSHDKQRTSKPVRRAEHSKGARCREIGEGHLPASGD